MFCVILLIALLSVKPLQCFKTSPVETTQTVTADKALHEAQKINDAHLMSKEACQELRASYLESEHRLILLDNDAFEGPNCRQDQARTTKALKKLAADPKNEIWIITEREVSAIEETYGHIPQLNLAGSKGIQFSKKNKVLVELPEAGPIKELEEKAAQIASELRISDDTPLKQNYVVEYTVPLEAKGISNEDKVIEMTRKLNTIIEADTKYKDYEAKRFQIGDKFRVILLHKGYLDKGILAEVLFAKYMEDESPINFGLSIGDMHMNEYMMSSSQQNAVLDRSEGDLETTKIISGNNKIQASPSDTYSHRLQHRENAISILENLAGSGIKNLKDQIKSLHRIIQTTWQQIKLILERMKLRIKTWFYPPKFQKSMK